MTRLMAQGQPCGRGRRPCGAGWGGRWWLALVVGLGVSGGALAEELPKDILADKYRVLADRALAEQKPLKALAALEKYEGVAPERNWEFLYIYGALLVRFGETAAEFEKGHDLLGEEAESRRGEEEYEAVLSLLTEADEKLKPFKRAAAEAEAKRQRQARFKQLWQGDRTKMVSIPGGSFRMGCTRKQRDCDNDEKPVHKVQVRAFEIGQYEVTQEVWEAVMGENPGNHTCAQCPMSGVNWENIQRFLDQLNAWTGGGYRLPTEAEWEYAARGGQQSLGYQYAGSDNVDAVGWLGMGGITYYSLGEGVTSSGSSCGSNTRPVGQRRPNELGVYDMSGNVQEWVQDCWHEDYRGAPADGRAWESENSGNCSSSVVRGGVCTKRVADRSVVHDSRNVVFSVDVVFSDIGVRLARTLTQAEAKRVAAEAERQRQQQIRDRLKMVSIPGGSFRMGCTREQRDCADDEQPVHEVQVRAFEIGQYEVTQELWVAVMGENPSQHNCAQCPVEAVSWEDVQRFLKKLNVETGSQYRLPTEAEWEYAARGGQQSRGYQYAGSQNMDAVGWYEENSGKTTHRVGQKEPNELGVYDMSGNVAEWVEDCWHEDYRGAPADGRAWESGHSGDCSRRVRRGGSWISVPGGLRAAVRLGLTNGNRNSSVGVRLARTLTP